MSFRGFFGVMFVFTCLVRAQDSKEQVPFLLPPAQDAVPQWVRDARAKIFNVRGGYSMIDPDPENPGAPPPFTIVDFGRQPEFPYAENDTVVLGDITHVQPFLSADKNGLYTEYTLKVLATVKNKAPVTVLPGDSLTLLSRGGVARFADGRVVRHEIINDIKPVVGRQYLAFLRYQFQFEAFYYFKIWLVQGGVMKAVFPDDVSRELRGQSEYSGKPLREVIIFLKDRVR